VHRVGADQHEISPRLLEALRRSDQRLSRLVPFAVPLPFLDLRKIDGIENALGGVQASQLLLNLFVDQSIVLDGRLPTHSADHSYGFHRCSLATISGHADW